MMEAVANQDTNKVLFIAQVEQSDQSDKLKTDGLDKFTVLEVHKYTNCQW